uniref:hypothetical protein n=1 Tax=Altererythrobacter segetis TaxID=1104773 RepID=UPI00140D8017|nr:hypothetical protein [Altererythrobacter segetis]
MRFGIFAKARFFNSGFSIHPVTGDQVLNGETTRGATDSTFGLTAGVQMESWW